jgi:thymidylate synthase
MTGSNDLGMIAAYNEHAAKFSDDGQRLAGAPGTRLLSSPAGDQLALVAGLLRRDPSTRRAVVQVYSPFDLGAETRDCPCLVSLQFLLRGGALHCIANMRSQSALMVMPYDLFLLTMIHEGIASRLQVPLGCHHHFCGSLHIYRDEEVLADRVLQEVDAAPPEMPCIPTEPSGLWEKIAAVERTFRVSPSVAEQVEIDMEAIPEYWGTLLRVMLAGSRIRHGHPLSDDDLAILPPLYRQQVIERLKMS